MREVQLPRELAFMIRNRLKFKGIPYREIEIDRIALDSRYIDILEEIISELREKKGLQ
jgi:hypothetical protein